jgi:hypothetical protein
VHLYADYFYPEEALYQNYFRMSRKLFGKLLKAFAFMTHISDVSRIPQVNLTSLHIRNAQLLYECLLME